MNTTSVVILVGILCVVLFVALIYEILKRRLIKVSLEDKTNQLLEVNRINEAVFANVNAYILLVDSSFKVLRTNYYQVTNTVKGPTDKKVGDLLQCANARAAANGCGTHEYCLMCPVRRAIQRAFDTKTGFTDLHSVMRVVTDKGTKELHVLISGIYFAIDKKLLIALTIHDITRMEEIQEELRKGKEAAEQSSISKSAFLANMSHEIRTPLNVIVGFSDILVSTEAKEEKEQYQEIIKSNVALLIQLVNDILDITKVEAGMLDFVYSSVDINQMMSDLFQQTLIRMGDSSRFTLVKSLGLPECMIVTDRNRVSQIILNFLSNAIKYAGQGKIEMGYELRNDKLYFFVTDSGIGISQEELPKLFDRFYRVDKTKEGTGLGLSICKTIIEKLGGEIGAESAVGKGATFWFTLPYKKLAGALPVVE